MVAHGETCGETYGVRIGKEDLGFAAGHFITLGNDGCESLHGHNFRVAVEVDGPLDADRLVLDLVSLKRTLEGILAELDHRVLVPTESPRIRIEALERSVRLSFGRKEWVLPREDCALLPVENTTVELVARWIGTRLLDELGRAREGTAASPPSRIRVEVEESPGESAAYERRLAAG